MGFPKARAIVPFLFININNLYLFTQAYTYYSMHFKIPTLSHDARVRRNEWLILSGSVIICSIFVYIHRHWDSVVLFLIKLSQAN